MQRRHWGLLLVASLIATAGCRRETARGGGPLPPADPQLRSQDSIQNPFTQIAPGVFTRVVYRTPPSAQPGVELRDVELAPGKTAEALVFPGAVVLAVRSGTGSAQVSGKTQELRAGTVLGFSQGDSLRIANQGSTPLGLRVYLIEATVDTSSAGRR